MEGRRSQASRLTAAKTVAALVAGGLLLVGMSACGSDSGSRSETATSAKASTTVVKKQAGNDLGNVEPPKIVGQAIVGTALEVEPGRWAEKIATGYDVAWFHNCVGGGGTTPPRCDDNSSPPSGISYTVVGSDVGGTLSARVTVFSASTGIATTFWTAPTERVESTPAPDQ
jgi:hypothetical protein